MSLTTQDPSSNQHPPISPAKKKALTSRDANAIQYTKSQLNEGDTLVFVRFPNGRPVYDATGFRLSDMHRVHSDKLKAASPIFKEALENDWTQHRCRRRNKLLHSLPDGIRYVLDLTPPEEGDDALALTAELSCSLGIRRWYKSEHTRVASAHGLVGGKDETIINPDLKDDKTSDPPSPDDAMAIIDIAGAVATAETVAEINGVGNTDVAFKTALEQSKKLSDEKASKESDYTKDYSQKKEADTLDYCPIRHRTGIERLLQIIEGKDPRLDSAPKVWTLAVLAKHFECHNSVVDYIITWMIAEPNCKIFEILPEDCLRIGMLLQNEVATRYAFTILVSEEAFRVGTGRSDAATQPNTNYPAGKQVTKFGRARESLDEDTLNLIQHAGRNFHARIEQEIQLLLSPNMNWLHALPEFSKILKFKDFLEVNSTAEDLKSRNVKKIISNLVHYIRGRLLWCFYQPLDEAERKSWNDHRDQEGHHRIGVPSDDIYTALTENEKLMTRFYWGCMRLLKWQPDHSRCATNLILDSPPESWLEEYERESASKLSPSLEISPGRSIAWDRLEEIWKRNHSSKLAPTVFPPTSPDQISNRNVTWTLPKEETEFPIFTRIYEGDTSVTASPHVPIGADIGPFSPFFNLYTLFNQIEGKIHGVCNRMLSRGEIQNLRPPNCDICDTLLCLGEDEYKYLPLWANGLNDGTGGVFEEAIPPAERGGAMGPGPAYHTGSTVNS
ncbi:hypothetical protein BKA64DRAFT_570275, partial [Cadophora sp. MPI-SDFR-AT-0126]